MLQQIRSKSFVLARKLMRRLYGEILAPTVNHSQSPLHRCCNMREMKEPHADKPKLMALSAYRPSLGFDICNCVCDPPSPDE